MPCRQEEDNRVTAERLLGQNTARVLTSEANPGADVWLSEVALVEAVIAVERDPQRSSGLRSPTHHRITSTDPPSTSPPLSSSTCI